jgi:hypothetical protein
MQLLSQEWEGMYGSTLVTKEAFSVENNPAKQQFLLRNHGSTAALFNDVKDLQLAVRVVRSARSRGRFHWS